MSYLRRHVLSTTRFINGVKSIIDLNDTAIKQYKNSLSFAFLCDYVTFYNGDIKKMKLDIDKKMNTSPYYQVDSFWSVWFFYMQNRAEIRNNPLIENNIDEQPTTEHLQILGEAARKSLDMIEKYGNGGVFRGKLKEYFDIRTNCVVKSFVSTSLYEDQNLYFMPKVPIAKTSIDMNIGHGILKGNYHKDNLYIIVYFSAPNLQDLEDVTMNNESTYKKLIDGTDEYKYVRKVKNAKFQIVVKNRTQEESLEDRTVYINNFYLPGFFEDRNMGTRYWAMEHIAKLFNNDIVHGYSDREFKPKNNVSIGEFLLIATKALLYDKYKNTVLEYKKINNIAFSNYAEFLDKHLGIEIEYENINDYANGSLNKPATRGYIAKVLTSILTYREGDFIYSKLDGDWDTYSNFLNSKCIASGKEDELYDGYMRFAPDDFITRDELSVMIVNAMQVNVGGDISCQKRKIYPTK